MNDSESVDFYPAPMSLRQHLMWLAGTLIAGCLGHAIGGSGFILGAVVAGFWANLYLVAVIRKPYISVSDESLGYREFFSMQYYPWSHLTGEPVWGRWNSQLTVERDGLRSLTLCIPLTPLSEEDRARLVDLVEERMGRREKTLAERDDLKCLECGALIGEKESACPKCGWTWK